MKKTLGSIGRLGILAVLLFSLGLTLFLPNMTNRVAAQTCCTECPVPPGHTNPTASDICKVWCGDPGSPPNCFDSCMTAIAQCLEFCDEGC